MTFFTAGRSRFELEVLFYDFKWVGCHGVAAFCLPLGLLAN
jgi:hypothetical protein